MKLNIYIIILCSVFCFNSSNAQVGKIKRVTKKYNNLEYEESKETLLNLAYRPNPSPDIIEKLANVYYFNGDMEDASKWYEELLKLNEANKIDSLDSENYFRYAHALKAQEKYDEADAIFDVFLALNTEDLRAKSYSDNPDYLHEIYKISQDFPLNSLDVNTELSDFGASLHNGKLIFASSRTKNKKLYGWNGQPFLDLFQIDSLGNVEELGKEINSKYHEATATFSKDGKTLYFTRNNYYKGKFKKSKKNAHVLQIFKAELVNGTWSNIKPLPFNSREFNVAHPALSLDEKKLYFASDMPGTLGGSDLFVVDINEDGTYGTPRNLGKKINTEGRENFPFISAKDILYFSSNGHVGLGGLDVFKIDVKDIHLSDIDISEIHVSEIQNIGRPINSPKDDFGYVIFEESGRGYISSNRAGGKGDDDIYSFTRPECLPLLKGVVIDKYTQEAIPNASIVIYDADKNTIISLTTDELGFFSYGLDCLKENYSVEGKKEGYFDDYAEFQIVSNVTQTSNVKLQLAPIPAPIGTDLTELLSLNPIYFDFDESFVREDAKAELEKVIAYLERYQTVKLDVRSHTDSRGTDEYNIDLSNKRNIATQDYILKYGNVIQDRLSGKGYGESQLSNKCSDGVPCSRNLDHANRRSVFIFLDM